MDPVKTLELKVAILEILQDSPAMGKSKASEFTVALGLILCDLLAIRRGPLPPDAIFASLILDFRTIVDLYQSLEAAK